MMYAVATENKDKYNEHLEIIRVDLAKGVVRVRSTDTDLPSAVLQLSSEDAKTLALRAAMLEGAVSPAIKHCTTAYGDDQLGIAATKFKAGESLRPFLIVEFHSSTVNDMQFNGDSL